MTDAPQTPRPTPAKPVESDTPDRTTITKPAPDTTADGSTNPKPAKPATSGVEAGPSIAKPTKPAKGDAGDDPSVASRPKPEVEIVTEVTLQKGATSLRNVLDRFSAVDQTTIDALKKNPIKLVLPNADGTTTTVTLTSTAGLASLNGRQVRFPKGASDPKDQPSYLQINKEPEGTYGFHYVNAANKVKGIAPDNGPDHFPKPADKGGRPPSVITPPQFNNTMTEVENGMITKTTTTTIITKPAQPDAGGAGTKATDIP